MNKCCMNCIFARDRSIPNYYTPTCTNTALTAIICFLDNQIKIGPICFTEESACLKFFPKNGKYSALVNHIKEGGK